VGKDILTEASADVYELLDTGLGKCRMCVAARGRRTYVRTNVTNGGKYVRTVVRTNVTN